MRKKCSSVINRTAAVIRIRCVSILECVSTVVDRLIPVESLQQGVQALNDIELDMLGLRQVGVM